MEEVLKKAICQWCYGKDCRDVLQYEILFGGASLWVSRNASVQKASCEQIEVVIIGDCVDVTGVVASSKIAEHLSVFSIDSFEMAIENLCGVYVIFRHENGYIRVYGDAMHMMSVYYGIGDKQGIVASCEALIVDDPSKVSEVAKKVLAGAYEGGLYLAGDMTMYDNVKALLPNHVLDVSRGLTNRYFPREKLQIAKSFAEIDKIIDGTNQLVENSIREFSTKMKFASPLTPGADSRVNCAFLNKLIPQKDVLYYVIHNSEIRRPPENEKLVRQVSSEFGFKEFHFYPEVESFSDDFVNRLKKVFGPTRMWTKMVWAYHPDVVGRTIVSGSMIGHILGGTLGRNMPKFLSGVWFMKIAQRNISKESEKETEKWYRDAQKAIQKGYSIFDLWSWEIRCGRWNANTVSRDNIYGIRDVNFYNSHKIISEWCRIPRRMRIRKLIHKRILQKIAPSVAIVPFNPCINKYSTHIPVFMIRFVPLWVRAIGAHLIYKWRKGR